MCTNVILSRLTTFLGLRWHIDDLKWGKYLDLFWFWGYNTSEWGPGMQTALLGYRWCVGPPASPSPTIGPYWISLADLRDCHLGLFVRLYKNTSFFLFSPPKRQVWRRQIWHFWVSERGVGGAAVHAAAAGTPHHHTARWRQTLRPGHKYSQMHYVQECGWDIYSKKTNCS